MVVVLFFITLLTLSILNGIVRGSGLLRSVGMKVLNIHAIMGGGGIGT